MQELVDLVFALVLGGGIEVAKELEDFVGFKMDALDGVVVAAAFDGGPFDNAGGSGALRVAQVGLLVDFFRTGAGTAVINEVGGGDLGILGAVDHIEQAEFDGVGHGDPEIEVPRRYWMLGAGRWILDTRYWMLHI